MKMKKITAFIVAILSILTICSFVPASKVSADNSVSFVHGYSSYSLEYVLGKYLAKSALEEKVDYGYAYKLSTDTEYGDLITSSHVFAGEVNVSYDIEIYVITKNDNETVNTPVEAGKYLDNVSKTFTLVTKTSESDLYYNVTAESRAAYEDSIIKVEEVEGEKVVSGKLAGKELGDSFTYPSLEGLLVSNYFDYNALKSSSGVNYLTLYYAKPESKTFSTTTSSSFVLDQVGTYSFYVLAKDPTGTAMTVDTEKLTRKVGALGDGWYDGDKLVAPIFSFDFYEVKNPEIKIEKKVEEGYIGLNYVDASKYITIVANNEAVKYELWYSESDLSVGKDNWADTTKDDLKALGAVEITNDEEIAFNASTLHFTPNKEGSYYVFVTVADSYGEDYAVTYAINVNSGFTKVKYDTQFLKNNWVSFMFLGIALLSLIGIILLIFVKPKEEVEEEVTVVEKK